MPLKKPSDHVGTRICGASNLSQQTCYALACMMAHTNIGRQGKDIVA